MLIPKKVKHRKWHKLRSSGLQKATTKLSLSFGEYGLKSLTPAWVTSRQIEAARRTMSRYIKRGGKIWIRSARASSPNRTDMKLKELKEKSVGELQKMLNEERESVRAMRFAVATNQETQVRKIRAARKTIARILTLIKQNATK